MDPLHCVDNQVCWLDVIVLAFPELDAKGVVFLGPSPHCEHKSLSAETTDESIHRKNDKLAAGETTDIHQSFMLLLHATCTHSLSHAPTTSLT